jgi:hypothetical protein
MAVQCRSINYPVLTSLYLLTWRTRTMKVRYPLFISHARGLMLVSVRADSRAAFGSDNSMTSIGNSATILLVDDDEALRRLVERVLTQQGFHILEASDGAKALQVKLQRAKNSSNTMPGCNVHAVPK